MCFQDRDKLLKELEQMQQEDLAQRRQVVAQMPQQLFEPAYRRAEIREDWQRELETAFEDMYTGERRVRGDMVLHLKPQPLPVPSAESCDDDLDLSMDPEPVSETNLPISAPEAASQVEKTEDQSHEPQSRIIFRRLLNKIRSQQDQWSAKSDETQSDTVESGSLPDNIPTMDTKLDGAKRPVPEDIQDMIDSTILAGNAVPHHAVEPQAPIIQPSDRNKQLEELERLKQEQLDLLKRLEEEKKRLEAEYLRVQHQMHESKQEGMETPQERTSEAAVKPPAVSEHITKEESKPVEAPGSSLNVSAESPHIQIIRQYQQRLIEQNRQHKQSVEEARQRLQEYQQLLKNRYSHLSASRLGPAAEGLESSVLKPGLEQKPARSLEDFANASDSVVRVTSLSDVSRPDQGNSLISSAVPVSEEHLFAPSLAKRTTEFGHLGSSPFPHSTEQDNVDPTIPTQPYGREESITGKDSPPNVVKSPKRGTPLQHVNLQTAAPFLEQYYSSPEESTISPPYSVNDMEKQSSISSRGDYDTASDSFYALPPTLSLGLPLADTEFSYERLVPEPCVPKMGSFPLGEFSNVREFRNGLISSTAKMQAQQSQLRDMQLQLEKQRESLLSKQKAQEESLLQKQKELGDQMRKHQESLEHFLTNKESGQGPLPPDLCQITKDERLHLMSALLKALGDGKPEDLNHGNGSGLRAAGREQRGRPSKPPVTKTKLGPSLEQHELSAILEVETPRSGRPSSTGPTEQKNSTSGRQDNVEGGKVSAPPAGMQENSRLSESYNFSLGDPDLSKTSASSQEQSSNESIRSRTKLSWRQTLSLEAASFNNLSLPDQSWNSSGLSPYPTGNETGFHFQHPVQEGSDLQGAAELGRSEVGYHAQAQEAFSDHLSTTTISTGSFLTSEKADSSIIHSEPLSDLRKCNYSIIDGDHGRWSNSANGIPQPTRRNEFPSPGYSGSALDQPSHIQQIIAKYTKDLSDSLERNLSFHTPAAALDVSASNDHQLPSGFYVLDPKPDLNVSSTCRSQLSDTGGSQEPKNTSQSSLYPSSKEWSSEKSHSFQFPDSSPSAMSSPGPTTAQHGVVESNPGVQQDQTLVSSGSFHPLYPECTFNEPVLSSPGLCGSSSDGENGSMKVPRPQGLHSSSVRSYNWNTNVSPGAFQLSMETLRADSRTLVEDLGSFHELMATETTTNDSVLSEHPLSAVSRTHLQRFQELPVLHEAHELEKMEAVVGDQHVLGSVPQHCDKVTSLLQTLKTDILTDTESSIQPHSLSVIGSSAFSIASSSPLEDTGNARGILEEPELSLMSFPDSSFAGSEHVTTSSMSEHHIDPSSSEVCFHPLAAEVDHSMFNIPDWSSAGPSFTDQSTSQPFAANDLTSPVSLQEAFLKKKKLFVQSSSKRVEQMKQKGAEIKKAELKPNVPGSMQAETSVCDEASASVHDGNTLKKVVQVRVCTPEERKLSEIEMHQRTIRLYNRLDEVRTKKEEKMRKESYARNREKANEFKKKTLEKLRTSKK